MANKNFQLSKKRQEDISELAEFLANEYCPGSYVDPKIVAENHKISYCFGNYGDAFDGLIEHEFGNFHIYINLNNQSQEDSERARFTFAMN